jgi:hypothetical protein
MTKNDERVTLRDALPIEFMNGEFNDTPAYALRDLRVVAKYGHGAEQKPWPGKQKNVMNWYALENGMAVGWNENPSRGWSFPVITLNATRGAPRKLVGGERHQVYLDDPTVAGAIKLGNGSLSEGLRHAVRLVVEAGRARAEQGMDE